MKKTSKILLSAALTATVCASLIVGSTLALFQSKTESKLVVSSGKVNVTATLGNPTVSATTSDKIAVSTAIGSAIKNSDSQITLENFTPGDCAKFDITVTNNSTIKTTWQLTVEKEEASDETLYNALTFSVASDNAPFQSNHDLNDMDGNKKGTNWGEVAAAPDSQTVTLHVTVQFPETAGDDDSATLMGKKCTFKITLHVMQGNAKTENPEAA